MDNHIIVIVGDNPGKTAIVEALKHKGVSVDDVIIITSPEEALKMKLPPPPKIPIELAKVEPLEYFPEPKNYITDKKLPRKKRKK